jgi:hypothetical protein
VHSVTTSLSTEWFTCSKFAQNCFMFRPQMFLIGVSGMIRKRGEFSETKDALLRYYSSKQSSQAARLVGFGVALFTLLQVVQQSKDKPLSDIFINTDIFFSEFLQTIGLSEVFSSIGAGAKFFLFLASLVIIMTFLVRTFFRFAVFAQAAEFLLRLPPAKVPECTEPIHSVIDIAVMGDMKEKKAFGFRLSLFTETKRRRAGWVVCLSFAIASTLILTLLLW